MRIQISYRVDKINAGWFVVVVLQSTIEIGYETVMGNGWVNAVEERLGRRRDGEVGSETLSLCLIVLVCCVRVEGGMVI